MSTSIVFPAPDGATYIIPAVDDENWGQNVTNFLVAIPAGVPPRNGIFSLTGDLSFGPSFGLLSKYYKSLTSNPASTGAIRLANTDALSWRNAANTSDLPLGVNGSNQLTFNGSTLAFSGAVSVGTQYQLGYYAATGDTISGLTLIAPNKALQSDANGLPVASSVSSTTLAFLDATSSIQTQINSVVTTANAALPKAGGTMSGNINMGSQNITNMANGVSAQDAVTVSQLNAVGFQPGDMKAAAYSATPSGWLLCDGTSYLTATYPALFAAIGYAYGGAGANFNVPNMVNNVPVGQGGSIAPSLGSTSGATTHTLSVAELPTNIPVAITDPGHFHTLTEDNNAGAVTTRINANFGDAGVSSGNFVMSTNTTGITAVANGSNTAHSIVQPSIGINWFIKT